MPRHCAPHTGLWGTRVGLTHTTAWDRRAARSALLVSCALGVTRSRLASTGSVRDPALLSCLRGRQEGAGSAQHPVFPGHPCRGSSKHLSGLECCLLHVVLSPAQSRNSQLELACTRLVQWYLSLLPLSDLITRKKLNLTSCRCPEGTLKNSCFSQRLLILHVRRFHSRLAINQVFAWKRPCVPDSTMSPIYSSGGFAAPSLCLRCGLGREVAAVRAGGCSGGSTGRSGLQHPARHWSHTGLNLPPVLSTSRRQ